MIESMQQKSEKREMEQGGLDKFRTLHFCVAGRESKLYLVNIRAALAGGSWRVSAYALSW